MQVKINNIDHNLNGITKINNKITFIENALPNETLEIEITKEKTNYNIGKITKIIKQNKERITPKCPYYNECGGCDTFHITYNYELELKKEKVKNILKKYANIETNLNIVPSNKELNYRNKITLHNINNKIGYMKKNSKEIIKINNCLLAMENINKYIKDLPYTKEENIEIRTNNKEEITSKINNKKIIMEINKLKFQIDANSFFQVNNYICSEIFKHINNNIENVNTCLDLYSGVGTLSILTSKKANTVYGIEINKNNYENALKNKELNKTQNVKFLLGKVEDKIKEINKKIDLIITDPPRNGMDKITINTIKKLKPKTLIYISCDPMTLARDLKELTEIYKIKDITLFDMFPRTKHIETVVIMNINET